MLLSLVTAFLQSPKSSAAAPPTGFVVEDVLTGLDQPIALRFLPDGRLLVLQKKGLVRIVRISGDLVEFQTYMDFASSGHAAGINFSQERGLLDLAIDPAFPSSPYIYVFYTPAIASPVPRSRIARFTHVENQGGVSSRGSLSSEVVLWQDSDGYDSCCHFGGGLDFGPDGRIWLTTGDHFQGSYASSVQKSGGKVHRINKNGSVPSSNPYHDGSGSNIDSVFAYGLRNPFRARWDIPSGRFFIAEVGGNDQSRAWEDLHWIRYHQASEQFIDNDFGTPSDNGQYDGINFGWPLCEGLPPYLNFPGCSLGSAAQPVFAYPHNGNTAAINGGIVYRGTQFPSEYRGAYFYADSTRDFIRYLRFKTDGTVAPNPNPQPLSPQNPESVSHPFDLDVYGRVVYLDVGPDGALYYVSFTDSGGAYGQSNPSVLGAVRRYVYEGENLRPTILDFTSTPSSGSAPLDVEFSFSAEDPQDDALTYVLHFGDGTSVGPSSLSAQQIKKVTHTYTAAGNYNALLEVSDGSKAASDLTTISVGNRPVITALGSINLRAGAPTNIFRYGDTIRFVANASDMEDGQLSGSRFEWSVSFVRPGNVHPSLGPVFGTTSLDFPIPDQGQGFSGAVFYRCYLTVTDSSGLTASATYDVFPDKSNITFTSTPTGILVQVDGNTARPTPFVLDTLINYDHVVTVPTSQCIDTILRRFGSWSSGETEPQILYTVPPTDSLIRANYSDGGPCVASPLPPPLSGLVVQLESDVNTAIQSGTTLAGWLDQSGLGNDLVANGNVTLGVTQTPTGIPAVSLDGSSGRLERTSALGGLPAGNADRTMFIVARYHKASASGGVAYGTGAQNQAFGLIVRQATGALALQGWGKKNDLDSSASAVGAGWATHSAVLQSGKATLFKNGSQVAQWSHKYNTVLTKIAIGREIANIGYIGMDIAALFIYDRALTASERSLVESYLSNKFLSGSAQDTEAPSAPGNLVATSAGSTRVNLSWTGSTDNVGIREYRVERCSGASCANFTTRATVPGTSFVDEPLTPSTTYRYRVVAIDTSGNQSGYSSIASATTSSGNTAPTVTITAPANGATFPANTSIQFSGTASDPEDGNLSSSIQWSSSIQGPLGTGGSLSAVLPAGNHTINARVTDGGNLSQTASITINVSAPSSALPTSGLVLHLESDRNVTTGSGVVTGWGDQSGSGNNLVGSGSVRIGVSQSPAGVPALTLNGSSSILQRTSGFTGLPVGNADRTMFLVAKYNSSTAWGGFAYGKGLANQCFGLAVRPGSGVLVLQGWGSGNDLTSSASGLGAGWLTQSAVLQSGTATLFKNGQQAAQWSHTYNTVHSRIVVGQEIASLGYIGMDVACILVYNRALNSSERQAVETYLRAKYFGS